MSSKNLLMLFVRNPELGKVKSRLAASVGPEVARTSASAFEGSHGVSVRGSEVLSNTMR